ncbi:MAG: hypoxanthine phosphoribosyltransferase [bacterium]
MVIGKPLLTAEQIHHRVRELGQLISEDYEGKNLLAVGILKGAFLFFSDLVRSITIPLAVDFIVASSYVQTDTSGEVKIHYDVRDDISGKDILLVEDIIDTGITLNHIRERLLARDPRSIKICAFLDKKERRLVDIPVDYRGFEIPNQFVVGYGLDYNGKFRNLPYVSIFKKSA